MAWKWSADVCEHQWYQVKCRYGRYDSTSPLGKHEVWYATSLTEPGTERVVYISPKGGWYVLSDAEKRAMTPEGLLAKGLVKYWSSSPWFKYGGGAYYATANGMDILSEFREPTESAHFTKVSHDLWAVLQAWLESEVDRLDDEGFSKEGFSKVLIWCDSEKRYRG